VLVALWRMHVELEDQPGRLGGPATADAAEVSDPATTALALARMVVADPGSAPSAVATMLRARLIDPAVPSSGHVHTLRGGTQQIHVGRPWPFTATELSRAAALLELATQLAMRAPVRTPTADRTLLLRDGSEVRLRAAVPGDGPLVAALHARCSPASRRSRYLSPAPRLQPDELTALLGPSASPTALHALLAVTADGGSAVGVANLDPEPDSLGSARAAVLVEDAWQGRGLGTALVRRIAETAAERGVLELVGMARPNALGVTRVLRRAGLHPSTELLPGEIRLRAPLPTPVG
jgi:GNAT superfamily N-acetyltransferase